MIGGEIEAVTTLMLACDRAGVASSGGQSIDQERQKGIFLPFFILPQERFDYIAWYRKCRRLLMSSV